MKLFFAITVLISTTPGFCQENKENIIRRFEKVSLYDNGLIREASQRKDSLLNTYTLSFNGWGYIMSITKFKNGKITNLYRPNSFFWVKYKRKRPVYSGGMPGCGTGMRMHKEFFRKLYLELTSE